MKFNTAKKEQDHIRKKVIAGLKESVKELNELYEEALAEYEALEAATDELKALAGKIYEKLENGIQQDLQSILLHWHKANILAKNNVRDLRDVLRNHKKRLKEIQNEI
jgi:hypothetical protein